MRGRFALPGCDYRPQVTQWAQRYTIGPAYFAATWREAMPSLLLVLDELDHHDLPGEFALLPYVESHYRPLQTDGNRAAGIWQLMPATARAMGLRVDGDYDARLDPVESTRAALDLIERFNREFGDWRLVNMAFNAGEYRVKRLLGDRPAASLTPQELASIKLSPTTHEHLDKLLALACIVREPERFGVDLPEPQPGDRLDRIELDAPIDLRVAARLAGIEPQQVRRLNAAHRSHRMATDVPPYLLLPSDRVGDFRLASAELPTPLWLQWRESRVSKPVRLDALAESAGIPAPALARANGLRPDSELRAGSGILLPGAETVPVPASERAPTHVVRSGDTLFAIARRYRLRLSELLRLNRLGADAVLRPGDRLRLGPP